MDAEMNCVDEASAAAGPTGSNHQHHGTTGGMSAETKQKLLARLGLESEAKLKEVTAGSPKKERYVEKMMVAELHHMQGELSVEQSALRNENTALKKAIDQLRAQVAMKNGGSQNVTMTDCTSLAASTPCK